VLGALLTRRAFGLRCSVPPAGLEAASPVGGSGRRWAVNRLRRGGGSRATATSGAPRDMPAERWVVNALRRVTRWQVTATPLLVLDGETW